MEPRQGSLMMRRLLNLLFPSKRRILEHDLDRELRYHLDRRTDDLVASGIERAEARRRALVELGGVAQVQEEVRDAWFSRFLDDRARDFQLAARTLRRNPGFATTAILSLALGIGANTAIFSLFDQLVLRKLPVHEPERLVLIDWVGSKAGTNWGSGNLMSNPFCRDIQEQSPYFESVMCRHPAESYVTAGNETERLSIEVVSGSYFETLGLHPAIGRHFSKQDDLAPDASPVVVVAHHYWKNKLGGTPDVVGRKLLLNRHPMTIVGVAPETFRGVDPAQRPALWVPIAMNGQANLESIPIRSRRAQWLHIFGRLKSGVSAEQAKHGLQPWFRSMLEADLNGADFPAVTAAQRRAFLASTIDVTPAPEGRSGLRNSMKQPLLVLITGTVLLLALACLNVANLFLARGASRTAEVTTRLALGATRARIMWPLLSESLLIALCGGMLGLTLAPYVCELLLSFVSSELSADLDLRVFLFAFAACIVTGCLCGSMPAAQAGRISLISGLRERSRMVALSVGLRKVLVAGQVAFTLILLIGVGLFVQTLVRLQDRGPGFATSSLLMFRASPANNGYSEVDAKRVMRELLAKVESLPVVENAAVANTQILTGGTSSSGMTIDVGGQRVVSDRTVHYMRVSPGFFGTLNLPLLAGRNFEDRDLWEIGSTEPAYRSIIVSESFAKRYFGNRNPLGSRIGFGNNPDTPTTVEIIGVVRGFSRRSMRDAGDNIEQAFVPFWDRNSGGGAFYVSVRGRPEAAFASIRSAAAQIDPSLPLIDMITLDNRIAESLSTERMLAMLSSGFGVIALLLSMVGLYGVISFVATHRTPEIGIRMALGASRSDAVWLIARDALVMIGSGMAVALPCVWALSRLVEAQLYGISTFDGPTIAGASLLLAAVALGSAMLPAWRAASIKPTDALRYD